MENKRWKTMQAKLVENKGWKTKMEKKSQYLFTSEVVSPGHPDKCADIIADSIVDRLIIEDSNSRVASEVFVAGKHVVIGGEVKSNAKLTQNDYEKIVKDALAKIGYDGKSAFTKLLELLKLGTENLRFSEGRHNLGTFENAVNWSSSKKFFKIDFPSEIDFLTKNLNTEVTKILHYDTNTNITTFMLKDNTSMSLDFNEMKVVIDTWVDI